MNRFSNSKLGMASQLKRKRTDVKSDGPQVAMHSQLPRFLVSVFFYCSLTLSRCEEADHQTYTGGSVIGKALLIVPDISHTSLLISTGGGANSVKFGLIFDTPLWGTTKSTTTTTTNTNAITSTATTTTR